MWAGVSDALNHKHLVSATTRHFERDIDALFCAGARTQTQNSFRVSSIEKQANSGRMVGFLDVNVDVDVVVEP